MHGPPVTVQVTSPTRRLFSRIVRVLEMTPLISSADATPAKNNTAEPTRHDANRLAAIIRLSLLRRDYQHASYTPVLVLVEKKTGISFIASWSAGEHRPNRMGR